MRSINFYSDLQCTQLIGTAVTQDYDGDEILYAARDSNSSLYAQSREFEVTIGEEVQNLVTTAFVGASDDASGQSHSIYLNQTPEIKETTVEIPIGEPDVYDPDNIDIKQIYVEGGIKLEYVYAVDEVNSTLIFGMWGPRYFTEYVEGQPRFDAVDIVAYNGTSSLLWVGQNGTLTTSISNFHLSTNKLSNFKLIIMEAPVTFFDGGSLMPKDAFIPLLMADFDDEGTTRTLCLSSDPYSTEGAIPYPAAITSNCLTSDEIIPEPEGEETNEGNNVFQDGQGSGIGVSDDAADIDVSVLNNSMLSWGGRGSGLSYYVMPRSSFSYVLRQLWNNFYKDPESIIRDIIGTFIFNEENNLSTTVDLDAIRQCLLAAFACPFAPESTTTANATCWIGPYGATAPDADYITARYAEISNISLSAVRPDFENDGFGDFSDFNNCTASLHLPFVGDISVDITTVARGDIRVKAIFDFYTGNIVYLVYTRSMQAPQGKEILYGVYNGNAAVEIPIMAIGSNSNILGRILNSGTAMATGVMSAIGGNVNAIPNIMQSGLELNQAKNDMSVVNRGGLIDHNSGPLQTLDITLQIRRARELKPENRRDIEGIESATKSKIGNFSGFLKVKSCDLKGLRCQESEVKQIEALLMEGVYV